MALTNNEVKNAKPREKAYKLSDGDSLFLLIAPPMVPNTGASNIALTAKKNY